MDIEREQATDLLFQIAQLRRIHRFFLNPVKDLTRSEHVVLRLFDEMKRKTGEDVKVKTTEISRRLHMAPQTLTPVIQSLVEKGIVERQYGEKDRRTIYLILTEHGQALTQFIQDDITEQMLKLTDGLSTEEIVELTALLKKMNGIIEQNIKK